MTKFAQVYQQEAIDQSQKNFQQLNKVSDILVTHFGMSIRLEFERDIVNQFDPNSKPLKVVEPAEEMQITANNYSTITQLVPELQEIVSGPIRNKQPDKSKHESLDNVMHISKLLNTYLSDRSMLVDAKCEMKHHLLNPSALISMSFDVLKLQRASGGNYLKSRMITKYYLVQ